MIDYSQALERVLAKTRPLGTECVPLGRCLGRSLAEHIVATEPAPRFDQSNVDGFGVRARDVSRAAPDHPIILPIVGIVPAGSSRLPRLASRTAIKIFTGAPVPTGVDAVVMKEDCVEENGSVRITVPPAKGDNIRPRGVEYKKGTRILSRGTRIHPATLGALASLGRATVSVFVKPRVAVIVTGDELVLPGRELKLGQIYESNSFSLLAALSTVGIEGVRLLRVKDHPGRLLEALRTQLNESDVVLTVGGISVGEFDFVKQAAGELGVKTVFWRVAMKPGMPSYFGVRKPEARTEERSGLSHIKYLFGLPGNPASALVGFLELVRPGLLRMMGEPEFEPLRFPALLGAEYRKSADRLHWVWGKLRRTDDRLYALPLEQQASHMGSRPAVADCLIEIPATATVVERDANVWVQPLSFP